MPSRALWTFGLALFIGTFSVTGSFAGVSHIPKTVGTDPAGDWGGGGPEGAAGGTVGMDLLRASMVPEGQNIDFMLDVPKFPPPEAYTAFAVYEWYFAIGDRQFGIYGPCQGHIYGDCASATDPLSFVLTDFTNQVSYMGIARLDDYEGNGRIVFPAPRGFLGAVRGSVIEPRPAAAHDPEAAVVAHTFYFVNGPPGSGQGSPRDVMKITKSYRVP